ncbi:uncharacterized protein K452DRAFT_252194 [Aplosporella prunicola CBS 121167]|uniref:t-SNARE coiled-coil homology domain-containing protein n=1 Tax=Aplosporella prunicola CBS 121167 TaxID=1176127 RepID=A0A6A6B957_9PEZI|nr:uncharacterized protein K452DRAFT_252194 [Aplosporella prunicola CBS 121167]KAF2140516.1 hypothetical protein K452DRAFT_252194 [Aplosporella prunicola CBS 121167]
MSYQQYGGNPYESGDGYGASANPYGNTTGGGYGSNPYGGSNTAAAPPPLTHQEASNYSQPSQYSDAHAGQPAAVHSHGIMSNDAFLTRVDGAKQRIRELTSHITQISTIHQRLLSDTGDSGANRQLEDLVSRTQTLNMTIKDEIKFLETDAVRAGSNPAKHSQVRNLKTSFTNELQSYQRLEADYRERYRDQIRRQVRIVNPELTEEEVEQAAETDFGSEGIFQTALKSNRAGHANSVMGAVRARHNDIQRIEKTMGELALLFTQLNEQVVLQEPQIEQTEGRTEEVLDQTKQANVQLDKGIEHIKRRNRLRRWALFVFVIIICIIALVVGLYFGLNNKKSDNNK